MKVFVTGANGLVGSFVVGQLLEMGYVPKLLLRLGSDFSLIQAYLPACEIVYGDILDPSILEHGFMGCEVVIHCAGLISFSPRRRNDIYKVNVEGTSNVVNACVKVGVKKIIHLSSIAALSRPCESAEIKENNKWDDSGLNSFYAKSKYLAELEVFRVGEEGLDYTIINPAVIIGPGDIMKSSTKLLGFISKFPWFYPKGYLSVVDVRDVARVACCMIKIEHKNRLVLCEQAISYRSFYHLVFQNSSFPIFSMQLPSFSLYFLAYLSVFRSLFVKREPIVTLENARHIGRKFEYKSVYYDSLFGNRLIPVSESVKYSLGKLGKR